MTSMTTVQSQPGWYPDPRHPSGTGAKRYFDGTNWTNSAVAVLSDAERSARLDAVIAESVTYGGRVESRSANQAVLVYGHPTSGGVHVIHFLMTMFTCGLWVFVWIFVTAMQHEKRRTVTVDPYGNVVGTSA